MDKNWKAIVGGRIREMRKLRGYTQDGLAAATDYMTSTRISNYEQGIREPERDHIAALAQVLDVPVLWLGAWDLLVSPDERALYYKYWGTDERGRWQIHSTADAQPATQAGPWKDDLEESA